MPSVSREIIEEITNHISKRGGDFTAWCVGTARDWHSPVLEAHEQEEKNDDLICREAYTVASARGVRFHFVNERGSTQTPNDASDGEQEWSVLPEIPGAPEVSESNPAARPAIGGAYWKFLGGGGPRMAGVASALAVIELAGGALKSASEGAVPSEREV